MAHWDGIKFIQFSSEPVEGYPAWLRIDCGCCAGLQWGGEQPRECRDCNGNGALFQHQPTGTIALYPGGPLRGKR